MPMHDWTRVDANDYHAFHLGWLASLQHALNGGVLPPGYFALAEHVAPPVVPDVLTLQMPAAGPSRRAAKSGTATMDAPKTRIRDAGRLAPPAPPDRRVAVRHARGRRLVAVIEVVSPSNKADRDEYASFVRKAAILVREGVHLLLVDPFPPTARDRRGLHAAVWRALTRRPFTPPADKPLTLAAYAAGPELRAFVEPVAVGDVLPDMPLFLTADLWVNVPLEATYRTAWAGFPGVLRDVLA